jgi:hypothetical protein
MTLLLVLVFAFFGWLKYHHVQHQIRIMEQRLDLMRCSVDRTEKTSAKLDRMYDPLHRMLLDLGRLY